TYNYHVTGSVYHHTAQDCDVDTLDSTLQYWKVKIENHDYMRIKMSDAKGHFDFAVPAGDYSLSTLPLTSNWDVCEPSFAVNVDDHIPHMNQDFLAKGLNDCAELELDFSTPLLRRCFNNYYSIRVRNTGPAASAGTSLTLELDPYFEFTSATIPYELVGDSIVNFDLGILAVNDEIDFQIFFKLSCDAPLGLEHCLTGELKDDHICGHERSTYVECQNNIGSIDPNDKRIFNEAGKEATTIDKGEYIYYHIRFQNTGTDTAFNIHITDPLSPTLDLSTLEILSASHPYRYSINDGPDLVVDFDNILLPDSSINEAASHGYFKFRVKPRAEYDYGTIIPNQAHIYFDFNDPVLTNEAILLISPKVGTKEPNDFVEFSLFPNPVKTTLALTISADDRKRVDQYEIIDQLGQTIIQSSFEDGHAIDVSRLSPGMYGLVLKVHGERSGMKRFVRL
ncbi:MAG TPA: T9SS type A sorting domain-containing protein, partial [Saprospiraceae bacterium]|nr:T9SS type A sorting domain-containing protein [Saprospiraceae bacterium]